MLVARQNRRESMSAPTAATCVASSLVTVCTVGAAAPIVAAGAVCALLGYIFYRDSKAKS